MTDSNYFHIGIAVDRSGSMTSIAKDMNGALEKFLAEQRDQFPDKKILVDVVGFDTGAYTLLADVPIAEVEGPFVTPHGMTALHDGIGKVITDLGSRFRALPEKRRPSKVLIVVITDGGENSSREWNLITIKKAVTEQENKYSWNFIFLGANIDAFGDGGQMGFSKSSTANFLATPQGVMRGVQATSVYASSYFAGAPAEDLKLEDTTKESTVSK